MKLPLRQCLQPLETDSWPFQKTLGRLQPLPRERSKYIMIEEVWSRSSAWAGLQFIFATTSERNLATATSEQRPKKFCNSGLRNLQQRPQKFCKSDLGNLQQRPLTSRATSLTSTATSLTSRATSLTSRATSLTS